MVLSHAPIIQHLYIVSGLGLAWASNGYLETCQIPVPILEYADLELLLDVVLAIRFLHRYSITHGDIKSENIPLFSDPAKVIVAKISDFGFSVLGGEGHFNFVPYGTRLWSSPEVMDGTVRMEDAHLLDIYSFGLLSWRVAIDGMDPLNRFFLLKENTTILNDTSKLARLDPDTLTPFIAQDFLRGQALPVAWLPKFIIFIVLKCLRNGSDASLESPAFNAGQAALSMHKCLT